MLIFLGNLSNVGNSVIWPKFGIFGSLVILPNFCYFNNLNTSVIVSDFVNSIILSSFGNWENSVIS